MEKEKTLDCLCIKSIDYKDNDKLVTLYAFGEGKITCLLRGVKKSKAKFLNLWVRVKDDWRDSEQLLNELGYNIKDI